MTEKLSRNLSDPRWREFWKGVDAAAARAPKLVFQEKTKANDGPKPSARSKVTSKSRIG